MEKLWNPVWTRSNCLAASRRPVALSVQSHIKQFHATLPLPTAQPAEKKEEDVSIEELTSSSGKKEDVTPEPQKEPGALTRRLTEMAEETMDTGSKSDRKMMQDSMFSEDLKRRLEERIAQTAFKAENQQILSEVSMPSAAGQGTREQARAQPWTGTELTQDTALRMLDDAHKRLPPPRRTIAPRVPHTANLRPAPKARISAADRLAKARDKTSIYAVSQQNDMSEEEREKYRKELKERFTPGARPTPTTLQGLSSLANERIEDAIARGQFKNIARGKGVNVERDYTANSPFLDTTEYFMNKIIQKQEIVPPWIEKQQELVKMVSTFRARLRNDWRRHAARTISSKGGSLADQVRRAKAYALAEAKVNPQHAKSVSLSSIDSTGNLTSVTIEERIAAGVPLESGGTETSPPTTEIKVTESAPEDAPKPKDINPTSAQTPTPSTSDVAPMAYPFRDPAWEVTEAAYQNLAISEINSLARSYNLMAPKIAQKPYYTLKRELDKCFAEVAPTLADFILERSRKPIVKIVISKHKEGGVMEKFGQHDGHMGTIRDEDDKKGYGFKQFWKDLFSKNERRQTTA